MANNTKSKISVISKNINKNKTYLGPFWNINLNIYSTWWIGRSIYNCTGVRSWWRIRQIYLLNIFIYVLLIVHAAKSFYIKCVQAIYFNFCSFIMIGILYFFSLLFSVKIMGIFLLYSNYFYVIVIFLKFFFWTTILCNQNWIKLAQRIHKSFIKIKFKEQISLKYISNQILFW